MYIMVLDTVPSFMVPVVVAHASLICYLKFKDTPEMQEWLQRSFRKVVCKVNQKEFAKLKQLDEVSTVTESALDNQEVCIVVPPQVKGYIYPNVIKFASMWTP